VSAPDQAMDIDTQSHYATFRSRLEQLSGGLRGEAELSGNYMDDRKINFTFL
jgi:hypothetical protein